MNKQMRFLEAFKIGIKYLKREKIQKQIDELKISIAGDYALRKSGEVAGKIYPWVEIDIAMAEEKISQLNKELENL